MGEVGRGYNSPQTDPRVGGRGSRGATYRRASGDTGAQARAGHSGAFAPSSLPEFTLGSSLALRKPCHLEKPSLF